MLVTSAHSHSHVRHAPTRTAAAAQTPPREPGESFTPSGELVGFNPTVTGGVLMVATGLACAGGIIATVAALVPGGANIAGGSALAAGLIGGMVSGALMERSAERHYRETGQGTLFMSPVMAPDKPFISLDKKEE